MENSIILPEISEIKKFISEAYEDSKKKMNLRTNAILNEIALIKKEQENFYLKTMEILVKYENEGIDYLPIQTQSRESSSTNHRNKSKSPVSNLLKNSMNIKESLAKNKIDYIVKKKKNEYAKKNTIKTATHKQIESIIKSKVKNRPNISISQMKKQNKIKIGGNLIYNTTATSIKNGTINSPPFKETAKRSNTLYAKHIANSTIVKADSVYSNSNENKSEVKREDKRKMTNTEIRKFSIIDIPCIPMNENNKIQNETRYRDINSNNCFISSVNFTDELDLSLHERLCLILAKSNVLPLKKRITFSTMIPKVYSIYPPSEVLKDYIELINEKIKKINHKMIYVNKFHPSITAQTTLNFIMEKEEQSFFSTIINDSDNIVLHLLQLLHTICEDDSKETFDNVEALKNFLLKTINGSLLSKFIISNNNRELFDK